jgi:hypothetical protein
VWTAIGGLRDDANGKDDACSNCINRINNDVHLLQVRKDYWKTDVTEWAAPQEPRQLRNAKEIGNIREESHCGIHECHTDIAEQLHKEMKVQVEKIQKDEDEIMRRLREAKKQGDEADNENAETDYSTEIEILRNFQLRSGAPLQAPPKEKHLVPWRPCRPEDKMAINSYPFHLHQ